ncbi:MAG: OmpA family protein [Paracoccaceae bacterium]|jgi:outer membrane protein OmpA-like peptidoglycan-associated protein|nr:OmpA family protein [Paracoccaceae bacterium]
MTVRGQNMRFAMLVAAALALSACDNGLNSFNSEAGLDDGAGGFGNATMNNTLVMSGQRDFAISLTKRFAADVPNTVNFAFNSAALDGQAQANLRRQADWIRQFPEVRFRVYGHTDLVGTNAYNKALGLKRAQAVVAYLSTQGISRTRLEAVVSYGETQPLVYTDAPNQANRRTVTEVSGFVKRHPTVLNGKYAEVIFRQYVDSAQPTQMTQKPVMAAGTGG